jgi:hypothetical protein
MFFSYVALFRGVVGKSLHLGWRESYEITMAGLAAFVAIAALSAAYTHVTGVQALGAGVVVAVCAGALSLYGAVRSGRTRCVAVAIAAGGLYGLVSVFIRHLAVVAREDGLLAMPLGSLAGLVAAFLAGSWLVQQAYAHGPADLVVAFGTTLNPIVAIGIGVIIVWLVRG